MAVMSEFERLSRFDPDWDWARTAVISREWKFLEPIRSYCEMHQIPVQLADEEAAQFWRLRETQSLVTWLRNADAKLVDSGAIRDWIGEQAGGVWWSLLGEALDEYAIETGNAELPIAHFVDWLAEWGREVRRRQNGLMLLTAHRAKGLEFDHVAVLDGAWDKVGKEEDRDAPRRLYYVAMTRARKTLALALMDGDRNELLHALLNDASTLIRKIVDLPNPPAALGRRFVRSTLRDVDLGFAGRYAPKSPVHQAIASLMAGDPLRIRECGDRLELTDTNGNVVGRMAKAFTPPRGTEFSSGRVVAIIVRQREDAEVEYQERFRCDRWEVVVPELVFSPR
jgi:ATP-dependent DNA helicase RecQ